jgi:DNA-binding transcriptional LysR family regulator
MINLKQLQAFVRVVEQESFTKAAQNLYLTQPAVSWLVKSLENLLGVPLLQRRDRRVFLTEAGELLWPYARQIVALSDEMLYLAAQIRGLKTGRLRLGASTIPGEYILPWFLAAFVDHHPGLSVQLRIADTAKVIGWVRERAVDFGVVGAKGEEEGLEYLPFLEDELVLLLPPKHPLADRREITPYELTQYPLVMRESGSGTRAVVEERLLAAGFSPKELNVVLEVGSTRAVITAVKAGLGMGIVSRWAVKEGEEGLKAITLEGLHLKRPLYLVLAEEPGANPAAQSFREFLLDEETRRCLLPQ